MVSGGPHVGSYRRILLRSPKDPFEVASPVDVFAKNLIGTNAGNLIFLQATWKMLGVPGATLTPDGLRVTPGERTRSTISTTSTWSRSPMPSGRRSRSR